MEMEKLREKEKKEDLEVLLHGIYDQKQDDRPETVFFFRRADNLTQFSFLRSAE